GFYRS
ncbi:GXGXG motif family protein, partial [Vibrio parahaemolyticus V-223/04]